MPSDSGAGSGSPRAMQDVLAELPLSKAVNGFADWLNRQMVERGASGAIGPRAFLQFLVRWCMDHEQPLTRYLQARFLGSQEASTRQAVQLLEPSESSHSESVLSVESQQVLQLAQNLVRSLRKTEIEIHHIFAALLLYAQRTEDPDGALAIPPGRTQELRKALLGFVKESGLGEAWEYWERAFQTADLAADPDSAEEDVVSLPPPRRLKPKELAELGQFFKDEKIKLSYAVTSAITNGAEAAAGFAEAEGTCIVGSGILFLGFLEVATSDRGKEYESRSLPIALFHGLDFSESQLNSGKARYFKIQDGFDNDGGESGLVFGRTFWEVFTTALEIQQKCSPSQEEKWISARHFVAALLKLDAAGGASSKELQNVGFEPHLAAKSLQEHLLHYRERDSATEWEKFFNSLPEPSRPKKAKVSETGFRLNAKREAKDDELCLDIEAYSLAIADTFTAASEEDDFVFALYAPWGRGKSTLIRQVAKILGGDAETKQEGRGYKPIFFSAWKYPTRPEVWVHLYQILATAAHGHSLWQKLRIGFRVGLLKHGWWPLIGGLFMFALSRIFLEIGEWFFIGLGFLGLIIAGSFIWSAISTGKHFSRAYFSMPDHTEKLGLQAVIGEDLKNLLRVWITPRSAAVVNERSKITVCDFSRWPACLGLLTAVALIWTGLGLVAWKLNRQAPEGKASAAMAKPLNGAADQLSELPAEATLQWETNAVKLRWAKVTGAKKTNATSASIPESPVGVTVETGADSIKLSWNAAKASTERPSSEAPPSDWPLYFANGVLAMFALAAAVLAVVTAQKPKQYQRLFLVVDDLDRCDPDQMRAVIESLRLFLDEAEMSRRLQVAMLLDRGIFKRVVTDNGNHCHVLPEHSSPAEKAKYFREQEEKLFVASLQLPALSLKQVSELAVKVVDREYREQLREQIRELDEDLKKPRPTKKWIAYESSTKGDGASRRPQPAQRRVDIPPEELPQAEARWREAVEEARFRKAQAVEELRKAGGQTVAGSKFVGTLPTRKAEDVVFSDLERELIRTILSKVDPTLLTPRSVRAFVIRYQLARLVLHRLGHDFSPSDVVEALTVRLFPDVKVTRRGLSAIVQAAVEMVTGQDEEESKPTAINRSPS